MSRVVEHLAELTGFRDRDSLDVSLAAALKDLLAPLSVAVYRCVGEAAEQRWILRARLTPLDLIATADPLWSDIDSLPLLDAAPERLACLQLRQPRLLPPVEAGQSHRSHFPLTSAGEAQGVVEVETASALDGDAMRLVSAILRVYRNFQDLLDYSERDTLTGLLNRKTFDDNLLRWVAPLAQQGLAPTQATSSRRQAEPAALCLAVIDIDHFKRVNDSFGHLIGDEVLLLISRLMRSSFRYQDQLYRFGGEEFVVLMRCAQAADAAIAFERLRGNVERHNFPQVGRITISVGYTEVRSGDTPSVAFDRADKAVYHAKQNGRNQVHHHAALVAAGLLAVASHDSDVELF